MRHFHRYAQTHYGCKSSPPRRAELAISKALWSACEIVSQTTGSVIRLPFSRRHTHHCFVVLSRDRVISLELSGCNISPIIFCKLSRVNKLIQQHNARGNQFSTSKAQTMLRCCWGTLAETHCHCWNWHGLGFLFFFLECYVLLCNEVSGACPDTIIHWGKVVGSLTWVLWRKW